MKSKKMKIVIMMSIIVIFIICSYSKSLAFGLSDVITGGKNFISSSKGSGVDENLLSTISNSIYNILLTIAIIVDIVVGIIIGIKLMTSEAENKAEAKKSIMVFVIGSVIVYGAFGIWKVMVTFLNTI